MFYDKYRDKNMPRKTIALITGLVLITVVLFVVALQGTKQEKTPPPATETQQQTAVQPTEATPAHSVLALTPNPVSVQAGQKGSVDVTLDASDNKVTAIQLEISYDPAAITNVQVTPGPLFLNQNVLINRGDVQKGTLTYAVGITPKSTPVVGTGVAATITFTAKSGASAQSQLTLQPTSLVTAQGVRNSVLKSATGTTIIIGSSAGTSTGVGNTVNTPASQGTPQ